MGHLIRFIQPTMHSDPTERLVVVSSHQGDSGVIALMGKLDISAPGCSDSDTALLPS